MHLGESNNEIAANRKIVNAALQDENFCFAEYDVEKVCAPFFEPNSILRNYLECMQRCTSAPLHLRDDSGFFHSNYQAMWGISSSKHQDF